MKSLITLVSASALSLGLIAVAPLTAADNLVIPLGQQSSQTSTTLPQRGLSTGSVSQRYGQPVSRHPAVGQPPITRWDYADFSVYFEYDKVIHSVRQHRRQTP